MALADTYAPSTTTETYAQRLAREQALVKPAGTSINMNDFTKLGGGYSTTGQTLASPGGDSRNMNDFTRLGGGTPTATQYPPDYRQLYESALGTVKDAYQVQRDNLTSQQAALPYQYQQQKDTVYNQAQQTGRALDETNAQRGLYNSGAARTDLSRNMATRDSGVNDINNQQNQAVTNLRNQLNQLGGQEANAIAGIQGQQGQDERNFALQQAALTGYYNGAPTAQQQQYQSNLALQQAGLTGMYNGQQTQAASNQSYSNQLALLQALQNYNLGVGEVTDTLPQFKGYNYGDVLKQLLASLSG